MTIRDDFPIPMLFAHRGASAHAPENTLAAFELAVAHQADAVELDANLTADNQVVVIHDKLVDRTTNGHGIVRKMPLAEIRELDAGTFFSAQYSGERIPTLDEVCETVGHKVFINIELKNYDSPFNSLPQRVAEIVQRHNLKNRIIFSSFLQLNLIRIKRLLPEVPVAILAQEGMSGWIARSWLGRISSPQVIHPHYSDVTKSYMIKEKMNGRRVHAWTVNDEEEIKRLLSINVHGIITDDPLRAREIAAKIKN